MKKFSVLAAFIFAVMISSTALAATWTQIDVGDNDVKVYVDTSSIKRGVHSAELGVDRADGFSANIKLEFAIPNQKPFLMTNAMGFFEDNGQKKKCYISVIDENGNPVKDDQNKPEVSPADGTDGEIWPAVYDYIQKILP